MICVELVKGFTSNPNEGNPAGIVIDSVNLSTEHMTSIAQEVGFSATAFLGEIQESELSIKFFSPRGESAICVHALLGAAERLYSKDENCHALTFKGINDDFKVRKLPDERIMVELPNAKFGRTLTTLKKLSAALQCEQSSISETVPVQVVSTGKPKLLIPMKSLDDLSALHPDNELVKDLCLDLSAEGILPFYRNEEGSQTFARHWNPLTLIAEDPICGVGSGALAAFLYSQNLFAGGKLQVTMGQAQNLPGDVYVEYSPVLVEVGGFATKFGEKLL